MDSSPLAPVVAVQVSSPVANSGGNHRHSFPRQLLRWRVCCPRILLPWLTIATAISPAWGQNIPPVAPNPTQPTTPQPQVIPRLELPQAQPLPTLLVHGQPVWVGERLTPSLRLEPLTIFRNIMPEASFLFLPPQQLKAVASTPPPEWPNRLRFELPLLSIDPAAIALADPLDACKSEKAQAQTKSGCLDIGMPGVLEDSAPLGSAGRFDGGKPGSTGALGSPSEGLGVLPPSRDDDLGDFVALPGATEPAPSSPGTATLPFLIDADEPDAYGMVSTPDGGTEVQDLALQTVMQDCRNLSQRLRSEPPQDETDTEIRAQYGALIQCYLQNLAVARQYGNRAWANYALNNLAVTAFVMGDYTQAIAYHQTQLQLAQTGNDPISQGIALAGMGAAHAALGRYDRAVEYYNQGLALLPEAVAPQWRALALRNLGTAYLTQGNPQRSVALQQQSLTLCEQIGDRYGQSQALGNLGNAYAALSEFEAAIAAQERSLQLAKTLGDRLQEAQALLSLGTTHSYRQSFSEATTYYQQSLALTRSLKAQLGEGVALTNLGDALLRLNRLSEAQQALTAGITIWESLRAGLGNNDAFKVSIFETQAMTYRNLQEVLIAQNQPEAALEVAERGRARAFVELLARRAAPHQPDSPPLPLDRIRQVASAENATLVEYSILREQFVPVAHGASRQFVRAPQESTLLIWVVQPNGQVIFRQVDLLTQREPLSRLVTNSRSAIGVRGRSISIELDTSVDQTSAHRTLQQLHHLLIEPIVDALPPDPTAPVVFIPQEALFLVPFPALQATDGHYLIERHTPLTAPSIAAFALSTALAQRRPVATPQARSAGATDWLIVGNPTMPPLSPTRVPTRDSPETLAALPGTEAEATAIAQLAQVQPLLGQQATEDAVKRRLGQADIIHLATHGLLDDIEGLGVPGAIALTPSANNDGWLTASEIFPMNLHAKLVVLSACDTGQGRITEDGVIGLSRSFMAAGVPSVVVSLWAVSDTATADLMTQFYQQLQQNPNHAQALRQAMLATMNHYNDPRDWAAFTLIGPAN